MEEYLAIIKDLARNLDKFELIKVPRRENTSADALAALSSTLDPDLKRLMVVDCISTKSIAIDDGVMAVTRSQLHAQKKQDPLLKSMSVNDKASRRGRGRPAVSKVPKVSGILGTIPEE